jgi:hypothetical protein
MQASNPGKVQYHLGEKHDPHLVDFAFERGVRASYILQESFLSAKNICVAPIDAKDLRQYR